MTSDDKRMLELSELLLRSLDETIANEQFVELEKQLANDPAAIRYYVQYLRICSSLSRHSNINLDYIISGRISQNAKDAISWKELAECEKNGKAVEVGRAEESAERILTAEEREAKIRAFIREERAIEEQEKQLEAEQRKRGLKREQRLRQRRQKVRNAVRKVWMYTTIGTMAAMLMVIGYLSYVIMQPLPPAFVAKLSDGIDVRWADPEQPTQLDSLLRPGTMKLVAGIAQITFDEGARIILEAPVGINLESDNRAYLQLGKLSATVPTQARGFKIDTPSASIVDLGTEFGVQVAEDGSSDIYVFKGEVSLLAGKLDEMVGKLFDKVEQLVRTGQAKRVRAGSTKIQDIQFAQNMFVRSMPLPYELAVRQSKPVTYWRFSRDPKQIADALQYSGNVEIAPIGPALGDGKVNNALKLDGNDSYVLAMDRMEDWTQTGFSLVLWVRPDTTARQNIILHADQDGPRSNYSRQLFMNNQGKFVFWILVWEPALPEDYYPVTLTSSTVAQSGKWHHVAVTVGADDGIRMFVNGSEENNLSLDNQVFDFKPERNRIYIGSAACGELDDREPMHSFEGGLDEIVRYNRALSPKEIRQLYRSVVQ